MGLYKHLSDSEKATIANMKQIGFSARVIAGSLDRHVSTVTRFINNMPIRLAKTRKTKCLKLDFRTIRHIWRLASNAKTSANCIKRQLALKVSKSTILRMIHLNPDLEYRKMRVSPALLPRHKKARLQWCGSRLEVPEDWHSWIFSDEKKFNLDGPDGFAYHWHDKRKELLVHQKRQNGGGSVMVWGAIGYKEKLPLQFLEGKQKAEDHIRTLSRAFSDGIDQYAEGEAIFQQDNASIHTANITKKWLNEHLVWHDKWPAKSPDLNPIENLWGILAREVYKEGTQYQTVQSLKAAIVKAWEAIDQNVIIKLYDSMDKRMEDVVNAKGNAIEY